MSAGGFVRALEALFLSAIMYLLIGYIYDRFVGFLNDMSPSYAAMNCLYMIGWVVKAGAFLITLKIAWNLLVESANEDNGGM